MIRQLAIHHLVLTTTVAFLTALPTSIAVVLQSLHLALRSDAQTGEAAFLVLGALPTSLYLVLPIAATIAVCWIFKEFSENRALPVMFSIRLSVAQCAAPGLFLAAVILPVSFLIAWFLAPLGVVWVEDAKARIRSNINISVLRPGKLHSLQFEKQEALFRFARKLGDRHFGGVFFAIVEEDGARTVIVSREAQLEKAKAAIWVSFRNGSQYSGRNRPNVLQFETLSLRFARKGNKNGAPRSGKTLLEMSFAELVGVISDPKTRQRTKNSARSEITKRLSLPVLALSHVALVLGLLFHLGPSRVVRNASHMWIGLSVCLLHVALVVGIELLARSSWAFAGMIGLCATAEIAAGGFLLRRAQYTNRPFEFGSGIFSRLGRGSE